MTSRVRVSEQPYLHNNRGSRNSARATRLSASRVRSPLSVAVALVTDVCANPDVCANRDVESRVKRLLLRYSPSRNDRKRAGGAETSVKRTYAINPCVIF